jgi:hypothetical protein
MMSYTTKLPYYLYDLLAIYNIIDPLLHYICIRVNKNRTLCKNVVLKVL